MKHLFIPYELAVMAKEKGFKEKCFGYYDDYFNKPELKIKPTEGDQYHDQLCIAPLYQQIVDWLRRVHSIYIVFDVEEECFIVYTRDKQGYTCESAGYSSTAKAIEEAFKLI